MPSQQEPPPETKPASPPLPLSDRLRDNDGSVPGMPGFVRKRKTNENVCTGIAVAVIRGKKVAKGDEPFAAVLALEFPKGLTFDPAPAQKAKTEASMKKFQAFIEEVQKVVGAASKHYESKLAGATDEVKVAAAGRIAQIYMHVASILARADIPADVRTGDHAVDKVQAYCEKLAEVAEPMRSKSEEAARICAAKVNDVPTGWWTDVCTAP